MAPTVILIRHAQALHNDHSLHDPPLSELGIEQCAALRSKLQSDYTAATANINEVAVVVSPMRRTMQTAMLSLDWLIDRGVKLEANADWQENSDKPCDTGSPVSTIMGDFPCVSFSNVDSIWPNKTSSEAQHFAHTKRDVLARGRRALEALQKRPEKFIFVVSHSCFLRLGVVGYWFFNGDYRVFEFDPLGAGTNGLKQNEATVSGGMGLSLREPVALGSDLPDEKAE